jgi:multidrug efflux pump subunit AcrA (membrane-fusion protein)
MRRRIGPFTVACVLGASAVATAQIQSPGTPNQMAARVERAPLHLTPPERYQIPSLVEPLRKVVVMAPADGVLKSLAVPVGATVKEGQEIGRLETASALAHLKIAMASVKEMQAEYESARAAGKSGSALAVTEARLDAAKARAELAQMEIDACTLRAPFGGKIMSVDVSSGQYLAKGSAILELADVSSVRVLLPVDRKAVALNGPVNFTIEGTAVGGKVQALLPLPERDAALRELAAPLAAAWVVVANPAGAYEPGQRAQSPFLPDAPISGVASYATLKDDAGRPIVQVIRGERVTDVPIRIIGALGPDRVQVSGPFRPSDVLIQTTSVPLRAGTFIRFSDTTPARAVEGTTPPEHVGESADVAPAGIAPIGAGRTPTPAARPANPPQQPSSPATTKPAGGVVPF